MEVLLFHIFTVLCRNYICRSTSFPHFPLIPTENRYNFVIFLLTQVE